MSRNSPEPISSDSEEEAVPLPGPRNRRERQVTPLGQNRDRGAAARDDDDRQNGRNAGAEAADPSFVPRGRRPDDGGNSRSPTSDGNQDEEENYPPFRFVERRDWVSRGDDGVRLVSRSKPMPK